MSYGFDQPALLWLLLLVIPAVWVGRRALASFDRARRWTAIALRVIVLVLLVLVLAGFQGEQVRRDLSVVALVDQSESVTRFAQPPATAPADGAPRDAAQWVRRWLDQSLDERGPDDRLGLVTFDARPTVQVMPSRKGELDTPVLVQQNDGTDIAAAIRAAMAMFPEGGARRIVLASDGNVTGDGADVLAAAREAKAAGVTIDVMPLRYRVDREVMVDAVHAPTHARQGQTAQLRIVLRAAAPAEGVLYLKRDGVLVDLSPQLERSGRGGPIFRDDWIAQAPNPLSLEGEDRGEGEASAGDDTADAIDGDERVAEDGDRAREAESGNGEDADAVPLPAPPEGDRSAQPAADWFLVRLVELPMEQRGAARFEATFEPVEADDAYRGNNIATAITSVGGKGRVLLVDGAANGDTQVLRQTLERAGIELEVIDARSLPYQVARLEAYDAALFADVPAEQVLPAQREALSTYVRDLGGGFVMIGGPDSFGAGGWADTEIDRLLPVLCRVPGKMVMPAGALVIVLDRSFSMAERTGGVGPTKQDVANEAAVRALRTLLPQDRIGVVAFDNSAQWVAPLKTNENPRQTARRIHSIEPSGGTNIYSGLELAYEALRPLTKDDAAVRHVILLTDGQSQEGDFSKLASDMADAGISLSTVGVGDEVNDLLLGELAALGGGEYYAVTDPSTLPQIFVKEARAVRRPLIREVQFVPRVLATGSPATAGLATPPPLRGFVLTGAREDPRVNLSMLGPDDEPVFAHWRVGLGQSAAFTSDATNRWAAPWLDWPGYGDFWTGVVRMVSRPPVEQGFELTTRFERGRMRLRLDASTAGVDVDPLDTPGDGAPAGGVAFIDDLRVAGSVLMPDGTVQRVTLQQTGPGLYEGEAPIADTGSAGGSYLVNLVAEDPAGRRRLVSAPATRPAGAEMRRFTSDARTLERIASLTDGRVLDSAATPPGVIFDRGNVIEVRSVQPMWRPLLVVLFIAFLLDIAARRIAWDGAMVRQWLAGVFGASRGGESRSDGTLGSLRTAMQQVDARTGRGERRSAAETMAALRQSDRREPATPSSSYEQQEASAPASETRLFERKKKPQTQADAESPPPEPAAGSDERTSRLLDAKRRARQRSQE